MIKEASIAALVGVTLGAVIGVITSLDRPIKRHGYIAGGDRCGRCRKEYEQAPHYLAVAV